jgi:hypothetical protein
MLQDFLYDFLLTYVLHCLNQSTATEAIFFECYDVPGNNPTGRSRGRYWTFGMQQAIRMDHKGTS